MNRWYENLIRNGREGALEAMETLKTTIREEEGKVRLDAIKVLVALVTTKEALQVPERHIDEYPLDVQERLLEARLKKVQAQRQKELEAYIPSAKEASKV